MQPHSTASVSLASGRHRRRWWALALLAAATLALAACGSDDDRATSGVTQGGSGFDGVESSGMAAPQEPQGMMPGAAPAPDSARGEAGAFDGAFPPLESASTIGRAVIRNGSVDLTVESVSDAFEQVRQIAEGSGGYVAQSTFTGRAESERSYLTLRVPAEQFGEVIERLRDLAIEVNRVSTGSQDVTEEYTDLQARLRNLRALEEQYLTLLAEASEIGEILQVQDRLFSVRGEVERVQGRVNLLDSLTSLATLEVSLAPEGDGRPGPVDPGFGDRVRDAWASSLDTLAALGTGIVVALVWGWWLIPLALVAAVIVGRLVRRWTARRRDGAGSVDTPDGSA